MEKKKPKKAYLTNKLRAKSRDSLVAAEVAAAAESKSRAKCRYKIYV